MKIITPIKVNLYNPKPAMDWLVIAKKNSNPQPTYYGPLPSKQKAALYKSHINVSEMCE